LSPPSTPRCCSPSAASGPASRSRSAPSATATTTPSARPSTPASRRRRSTGNRGRGAPRPGPPCSSTSRAGTTRGIGTRRSRISPRSSSNATSRARPAGARRPDFGRPIGRVDLAERLRTAHNASRLDARRRFGRRRLNLSRERPAGPKWSRSGRDGRRSRDQRQQVASPLGGGPAYCLPLSEGLQKISPSRRW
jgi:hypothetical protein